MLCPPCSKKEMSNLDPNQQQNNCEGNHKKEGGQRECGIEPGQAGVRDGAGGRGLAPPGLVVVVMAAAVAVSLACVLDISKLEGGRKCATKARPRGALATDSPDSGDPSHHENSGRATSFSFRAVAVFSRSPILVRAPLESNCGICCSFENWRRRAIVSWGCR